MDALHDPAIETVVVMSSAQVGKTEVLLNTVGYHIAQDPAPTLLLQPTLEMAQTFSKDRLAPMLRDTEALHGLVKDPRARDSGNTLLHKGFPGGHITMAGANAPASLASRPVRVVACDEVDRYPASAGTEGDPVSLARKRTANFWNRKVLLVSTPTVTGASRIERAYDESDQRRFLVPCPDCGHEQPLAWAQVMWPEDRREDAEYCCVECGSLWGDGQRWRAIGRGHWQATAHSHGVAGFHLSALYSPWARLSDIAVEHGLALKDPQMLRTWVNTTLGETWEEEGESVDSLPLYRRREPYTHAPATASLVTFGVDVQADRFEIEFVAWGEGEESWSLSFERLFVDPTEQQAWQVLGKALRRQWETEDGRILQAFCGCIDSGYLADEVYRFSRRAGVRFAIPVKGSSQRARPIIDFPRKPATQQRVYLTQVGTDTAKDILYQRLQIDEPGPGYCHFPQSDAHDEEYFKQLTGEVKRKRYVRGQEIWEYHVKAGHRVEALDCRIYAFAAVRIAQQHLGHRLEAPTIVDEPKQQPEPKRTRRRGGSWMDRRGGGWMR